MMYYVTHADGPTARPRTTVPPDRYPSDANARTSWSTSAIVE